MHDLPTAWGALCAVVFLLGLRHGFDADHLAAIDGLTRLAARERRRHAGGCGALFSLGHGVVVVSLAAAVGWASERWSPPPWLDLFGAWVSTALLLWIGIVNLRSVLGTAPGGMVALVGIKGAWLQRLLPARSPLGVAAVGLMFALSFDTLSQAALFGMAATRFGGLGPSLVLGGLFVLGMLAADGVNGWWISRLLARADAMAARASRLMGLAVAAVSLGVAALGLGRLLSPAIDGWSGSRGSSFGALVVAVLVLSYLAARLSARRPATPCGRT
jgi:high-affinity nickel-transport protein